MQLKDFLVLMPMREYLVLEAVTFCAEIMEMISCMEGLEMTI